MLQRGCKKHHKKTKQKNNCIRVKQACCVAATLLFFISSPNSQRSWSTSEMLLWRRGKLSSSERGLAVWVPSLPYQGHLLAWKSAGLYELEGEKRLRGFVVISRLPGLYLHPATTTSTRLWFHAPPFANHRHDLGAGESRRCGRNPFVCLFFFSELLSLSARPSAPEFAKANAPKKRNPQGGNARGNSLLTSLSTDFYVNFQLSVFAAQPWQFLLSNI